MGEKGQAVIYEFSINTLRASIAKTFDTFLLQPVDFTNFV